MLQNMYPDDFHVDIDYEPKIHDINYWKKYFHIMEIIVTILLNQLHIKKLINI